MTTSAPAVLRNRIGSEWIDGQVARDINPSNTDEVVAEYAEASPDDVKEAVTAAQNAFDAWKGSAIQLRHDTLRRASDEMAARSSELGRLLSREEGKTLSEGVAEVSRAAQIFSFYAAECLRIPGEVRASTRPNVDIEIVREPVGVIGVITPWNFPAAIPAWKIAPALCYGNTVVFKPASLAPATAWALVDILIRAGLPDGVLNLVMGSGSVVGNELVSAAGLDAITFTGSAETGQQLAQTAAQARHPIQLEMGGKNPLVILDDANMENAIDCALKGAYFSTGQRCTASSRIIATQGIYREFVKRFQDELDGIQVDNALRPETDIGPVVDGAQLDRNERYVEIGIQEGASLARGGGRLKRATPGFYMDPALFVDTTPEMRINQDEIFGPIAAVIPVENYEDALATANSTPYGLSSGICTNSLAYATHFKKNSEAGMVMVNLPTAGVDFHVPFGGTKASGFGPKEQGSYAKEFFTKVKTIYLTS